MNNYYFFLAQKISSSLADSGYTIDPTWIYAQMAHETNGFRSELCVCYHNLGGVTQSEPNLLVQPDGSNYYMSFGSVDDFATYFAWYLALYDVDGLDSVDSIESYLSVLKSGGYYGDSFENYLEGCLSWLATIQ